MMYDAHTMEERAVMQAAERMCAAIRTAPKTRGIDRLDTLVVTGAEKDALADEMERLAGPLGYAFFMRDAKNVRAAHAVVLAGSGEGYRGLDEGCGLCHFKNCADCESHGASCVYDAMDLGIALGSAVSAAADARIDNRLMFSIGRAARELRLMGEEVTLIIGIPLAAAGKSPFFDRK